MAPIAIECKWSARDFDASGLKAFGVRYPKAEFFVVAQDVGRSYLKVYGALQVRFVNLESLMTKLAISDAAIPYNRAPEANRE